MQRMTSTEVSNGLVLPYAAMTIAGKGGAAAVLLITFMAVTSTLSAQVIAVSSILSFDVYREYINRAASDRDIIRASHFGVIFFAAFSAGFSTMLHYVGIDLGWTLYMLGKPPLQPRSVQILMEIGVVTCPGIFPMAFTILWRRQSRAAAILSPILGMATGIGVWLGTAQHFYGAVSVSSTGQILPCVYGTVASAFSPIVYSVLITLVKPQRYDWAEFRKEKLGLERLDSDSDITVNGQGSEEQQNRTSFDPQELKRWGRIAAFWSIATFLGHWVLWPLPMYGSKYVFGKGVSICHCCFLCECRWIANRFVSSSLLGLLWGLSGCGLPCSWRYSIPFSMGECSRCCKYRGHCGEGERQSHPHHYHQ